MQVSGKSRRQNRLPLAQEVGDAILHYLASRPLMHSDAVFLTTTAPIKGLSYQAVGKIATQAIRRARVDTPRHGSHVLRHSAATQMLRQACPCWRLARCCVMSVETTLGYAKVDVPLLEQVVRPWPEDTSVNARRGLLACGVPSARAASDGSGCGACVFATAHGVPIVTQIPWATLSLRHSARTDHGGATLCARCMEDPRHALPPKMSSLGASADLSLVMRTFSAYHPRGDSARRVLCAPIPTARCFCWRPPHAPQSRALDQGSTPMGCHPQNQVQKSRLLPLHHDVDGSRTGPRRRRCLVGHDPHLFSRLMHHSSVSPPTPSMPSWRAVRRRPGSLDAAHGLASYLAVRGLRLSDTRDQVADHMLARPLWGRQSRKHLLVLGKYAELLTITPMLRSLCWRAPMTPITPIRRFCGKLQQRGPPPYLHSYAYNQLLFGFASQRGLRPSALLEQIVPHSWTLPVSNRTRQKPTCPQPV